MSRHTYKDGTTRRKPGLNRLHTIPGPPHQPGAEPGPEPTEARAERERWSPTRLFNRHCRVAFAEFEDKYGRPPEGEERRAIRARIREAHPECARTTSPGDQPATSSNCGVRRMSSGVWARYV